MNDGGVVVHYLFNLDRGLCDFSTAAASVIMIGPDNTVTVFMSSPFGPFSNFIQEKRIALFVGRARFL